MGSRSGALPLYLAVILTGAFSGDAAAADPLTIGFIYVGAKSDYGYNQAHAQGAAAIAKLPGVKIREEEMVPETVAVQKSMESMINLDGAALVFPTSFGYFDPHILKEAGKFKNVTFLHCGGMYTEGKHPTNVGSYFGYIDEAQYVSGIVAGLTTKSNKLGFVAAKPIGTVLLNINSFLLGAKKTNPNATVQVIFTGDWSLPVREAEATNALVDAGCDVITCHVDSPKVVIETAEGRGVKTCGHNASQAPLAPKGFITGAEYKWITIYSQFADLLSKGEALPNFVRGGYDKDYVQNTAYGAGATPEAIAAADAAKADMKALKPVFVGPLKDNAGNEVIAAGTEHAPYDVWLEQTSFLVDGVVGSIT
jgi:simple sugar transport system substrate-binding protein